MSSDRDGEWLRPPLFPSPPKPSPHIPLYFKGILKSAVFLSATLYPMSSGQKKKKREENKNLKNPNP